MELAVDLHIHSSLSPCADNDMTPNNIINMAILKGLDIISITDHNNAKNLPAFHKVALEKGIMLLPGIEVQTREEAHILCYFKKIVSAVEFGNIIYDKLPNIKNNEEVFGKQIILDSSDIETGSLDKLLLSSADISINELLKLTLEYDGICIPAHVDRASFSIISNLGFIPDDLNIKAIEISKNETESSFISKFPLLKNFRIIKASDAHYLFDISERENLITVQDFTLTNILNYLKCI